MNYLFPKNAELNFKPIANAIDGYRAAQDRVYGEGVRKENQRYRRGVDQRNHLMKVAGDQRREARLADETAYKREQDRLNHARKDRALEHKVFNQNANTAAKILGVARKANTPEAWDKVRPVLRTLLGRDYAFDDRDDVLIRAEYATAGLQGGQGDDTFDPYAPTADEKALGITRKTKMFGARQKFLKKQGLKPSAGHGMMLDKDGTPYQKDLSRGEPKGGMSVAQINSWIEGGNGKPSKLDLVEKALEESYLVERTVSQVPIAGSFITPKTQHAIRSAQNAAITLSYALSGKQISNAEQQRILNFMAPGPYDSGTTIKYKMSELRNLFKTLRDAKLRGAKPEDLSQMFDAALDGAQRESLGEEQGSSEQVSDATPQGAAPDVSQMSDEDLLKALNQ